MSITYPWLRYWIDRNQGYADDAGFLSNPEADYAWAHPHQAHTLETYRDKPVLILLGDAGMGKTRAVRQEYEALQRTRQAETQVMLVDLATFGPGELGRLGQTLFQGAEYASYREGGHLTVFLDSLDQALADNPRLDVWLADQLQRHFQDPARFRLRIASRTGEWTSRLEEELKSIWPGGSKDKATLEVLEICPLRRTDVFSAAQQRGLDAERFMTEIAHREIEPLASRPITLKFLFRLWERDAALPASKAEIYEQGIYALCEDEGRDRGLRSTAAERMLIAGRLASALMFCRHVALWLGRKDEMTDGDIPLYDLDGEERTDRGTLTIDKHLLRETVSMTALFTGQGRDRLGFAHYSFAEFLAAWYLRRTDNEADRLLDILRYARSSPLVPRLRETAAWLASLHRPVMERLLSEEPAVLLHVDGAALTDADKFRLTQALLGRCANRALYPHDLPQCALRKLAHPGLADQLRPWINDRAQSRQARELAIALAQWCTVKPLADALVRIALDSAEDYDLRVAATRAVVRIGEEAALKALRPLALGQAGPDPDRRLRDLALYGLWPKHLTAEEFFQEPIDLSDDSVATLLDSAIYGGEFFDTLRPEHLPAALDWVRRHPRHNLNITHQKLLAGIMRKAWQWLGEPGILEAFVHAFLALLVEYNTPFDEPDTQHADDPLAETEKRRLLLRRLLSQDPQGHNWVFWQNRLPAASARAEDLPWLLDLLDTHPTAVEHRNIAAFVDYLLRLDPPVEALNRVLDRCGPHARQTDLILRKALQWLTHPWRLKSGRCQSIRDNWKRSREREERRSRPVLLDPPPQVRVSNALERVERGKWAAWAHLAMELTLKPDSTHYGWPAKLHEQPGWQNADAETRERIQSVAIGFLRQTAPDCDRLFNLDRRTDADMAGLFAFELLAHTASHLLKQLTPEEWDKWAPLIVAGLLHQEAWERELLTEAHRQAPDAVLLAALRLVDQRDHSEHGVYNLNDLDPLWGPALAEGLLARLDRPNLTPASWRAILDYLLRHGEPGARARAQAMVADVNDPETRCLAAVLLFSRDTAASWPLLVSLLEKKPEFAKAFVLQAASDSGLPSLNLDGQGLDEDRLATLFIWLETHFPTVEDPVHKGVYRESS